MTSLLIAVVVLTLLALIVLALRSPKAIPSFSFTPNNRRRRYLISSNLLKIKARRKEKKRH
jgi:hypothetical protein